ncbi:hypothetical protein GCM10027359_07140 [Marilutibacter aestuarii]
MLGGLNVAKIKIKNNGNGITPRSPGKRSAPGVGMTRFVGRNKRSALRHALCRPPAAGQ